MVVTNISPEAFLSELKQWGSTKDSLVKLRQMKKGDYVILRLAIPRTNEIIQTYITVEQYNKFEFMNYAHAVPSVFDETDGSGLLKDIGKKLEKLNANTKA